MSTDGENLTVEERMEKRGIPKADFVDNIEQYLASKKMDAEAAIDHIKEDYRKYKLIEESFSIQKAKLLDTIEDYKKSLAVLEMLREQKEKQREQIEVTYKLDENVYSRAIVDNFEKVCIWLGANVMVEYDREEADEMLRTNLKNIERTDKELDENLDFVRDQITTTEVSVAQLFNYGVQQGRQQKQSAVAAPK